MSVDRRVRLSLRTLVLGYLTVLLLVPVGFIFYRTFAHGLLPVWQSITTPAAVHAFWLTLEIALIAVPLNTIFGVIAALALVRGRFRGKVFVDAVIRLPFALSPVVIGLALLLVYGRGGWVSLPFQVIFSLPGMVLATVFVSLPFVVREVVPVLRELGTEQEQAAATLGAGALQTFRRVTFPAIRWAVVYGVALTAARCLGEFGAVSIVSGGLQNRTQTLTQYVQASYENFDQAGAYAASVLLAALAILILITLTGVRNGNRST
jgi:sulfate/thiosulfate transport system permease protein